VAALLPQLQMLARVLPPPTLAWKLRLIEEGVKCGPARPAAVTSAPRAGSY